MPYIFIWSGYVYRGLDFTRLTQGTIEKYIGTRKKLIKEPLVPARYVNATAKVVLAGCASSLASEEGNIVFF